MTSLEGLTPVVLEVYEKVDAVHDFFLLDTFHNHTLSKTDIEERTKNMTKAERDSRLHGKPLMKQGLVFPDWQDRSPWVIPKMTIEEKDFGKWTFYTAIDPHLKLPFHALLVAVGLDDQIIVLDEIIESGKLDEFIWQFQAKWGHYPIEDGWIDPSSASIEDRRYGNSMYDALADADIPVSTAKKDPGERIRLIEMGFTLGEVVIDVVTGEKAHLPDIQICDNCEVLRKELGFYQWDSWGSDKTEARKESKNAARKKDDHLIDCLGYIMCGNARYEDDTETLQGAKKEYEEYAGTIADYE